jgi:hypothetical protein
MRRIAPPLLPALLVSSLLASLVLAGEGDSKLVFETPKEWKDAEVKGGMMAPKQQWTLEKAEGDEEAPTVKLYAFGGPTGTVDDNVKRWTGQFKTKDGEAVPAEKVKKETFEVGDLKITTVEIAGTYSPMRGDPKKGQKLIAAYIADNRKDGKAGPWFVRLDGPEKSVDKAKDAYVKWLKSAKLVTESK